MRKWSGRRGKWLRRSLITRREGEGEKAAKDTEAGEAVGAASLERGQAGVKTGVMAAKMAEVPRGGVEGAEENGDSGGKNGPNDGVNGGNSRRTSEDGNRSEKEEVSDEEEGENAEERVSYSAELTLGVYVEGRRGEVSMMDLLKAIRNLCGVILG
ncbi:hypothetical protein KUCAC02_025485 [Chaenocephalus aceratus]|uniref:Uncharacterized protein n=1 Tax=Chaenocephalus aceratus TaxID=36190 RepID=A0ACB9VVS8_CHAAC|nr:hypothetical protein KUCAC02_025485 [Chaenocephalus aceratus]